MSRQPAIDFRDVRNGPSLFFGLVTQGKPHRGIGEPESQIIEHGMMRCVCSWCGVELPSVPARGDVKVSHGICNVCAQQMRREVGL